MTADPPAPDRLSPDHLSPDHLSPDHLSPDHLSPDHLAPDHLAPDRSAPDRLAPDRLAPDRLAIVRQLRAEIGGTGASARGDTESFSTGCPALDALLPHGGLRSGALSEWVAENDACGAAALSLAVIAHRWRASGESRGEGTIGGGGERGPLVVVDPDGTFYPTAAVALGIPAQRIVWCRPRSRSDTIWSIDQALRCEAVAGVWAHVGDWLDDRDARRLQLAAELGKTSGWLIRPATVRGKPSFAETRFHVAIHQREQPGHQREQPGCAWWMNVTLDRARGGAVGGSIRVGIDDQGFLHHETAVMHLASQLADPMRSPSGSSSRSSPPVKRRGA